LLPSCNAQRSSLCLCLERVACYSLRVTTWRSTFSQFDLPASTWRNFFKPAAQVTSSTCSLEGPKERYQKFTPFSASSSPVFLNRRALASIIPGPRLIKEIYRAAVSQRLRATAVAGKGKVVPTFIKHIPLKLLGE
jgi:hypothetical protein